jgi:hypothetical protein
MVAQKLQELWRWWPNQHNRAPVVGGREEEDLTRLVPAESPADRGWHGYGERTACRGCPHELKILGVERGVVGWHMSRPGKPIDFKNYRIFGFFGEVCKESVSNEQPTAN